MVYLGQANLSDGLSKNVEQAKATSPCKTTTNKIELNPVIPKEFKQCSCPYFFKPARINDNVQ